MPSDIHAVLLVPEAGDPHGLLFHGLPMAALCSGDEEVLGRWHVASAACREHPRVLALVLSRGDEESAKERMAIFRVWDESDVGDTATQWPRWPKAPDAPYTPPIPKPIRLTKRPHTAAQRARDTATRLGRKHMDSLQPIYNTMARHLLTQGVRCLDDVGKCVLWNEQGERCAIGALLDPPGGMAQCVLEQSAERWPGLVAARFAVDNDQRLREIMAEAQQIHDGEDPEDWADYLALLAFDMGLDDSVLDAFNETCV